MRRSGVNLVVPRINSSWNRRPGEHMPTTKFHSHSWILVTGIALSLLMFSPLAAEESEPLGELPANESAADQDAALRQKFQSFLTENSAQNISVATGGEKILTEVSGTAPETDDERFRRIFREEMKAYESKKAELSRPPEDDGWKDVGSNLKMEATWKNGLEIESVNKDFRVHIGGRTQFGLAWFAVDQSVQNDPSIVNRFHDGADFRRARLRADGTMYEQIEWAVEYDFVNSILPPAGVTTAVTAPTDLWFTFTKLPYLGNVRVGNQKEPIGFEHQVSSRFLSFLERSFNQDAFYGGFNNGFTPGIQLFDEYADHNGTWAFGAFKPTTNVFASNLNDAWALTGRLTYLPWYEQDGCELLHLGIAARTSGSENGLRRYRTRYAERAGLSVNWPLVGDTGNFFIDTDQMLDAELAVVAGRFTMQAEYLLNWAQNAYRVNPATAQTLLYHGGYLELLYFLTDDYQRYDRKRGAFDRMIPRENYFAAEGENGGFGTGAWQVGVRYNYLNLNDKGINGGMLHDLTTGLNWFLNPNMKFQANYSISYRESPVGVANDGVIQGFGVLLAHDF